MAGKCWTTGAPSQPGMAGGCSGSGGPWLHGLQLVMPLGSAGQPSKLYDLYTELHLRDSCARLGRWF